MLTVGLISDYGDNSIDLMSMKLSLRNINSAAKIIDINNNIKIFDCQQAMFVLENYIQLNTHPTVIIVAVNAEDAYTEEEAIICTINKTTIITYNNGFLSFLSHLDSPVFYGYNNGRGEAMLLEVFAKMNTSIALKEVFNIIKPKEMLQVLPTYNGDRLVMTIVANDRFGNAFTNIRKAKFEQWIDGYNFEIILSRRDRITELSQSFSGVSSSSLIAYFTNTDVMAIGINMGDSTQLFRLKVGESFMVKRSNVGLF